MKSANLKKRVNKFQSMNSMTLFLGQA